MSIIASTEVKIHPLFPLNTERCWYQRDAYLSSNLAYLGKKIRCDLISGRVCTYDATKREYVGFSEIQGDLRGGLRALDFAPRQIDLIEEQSFHFVEGVNKLLVLSQREFGDLPYQGRVVRQFRPAAYLYSSKDPKDDPVTLDFNGLRVQTTRQVVSAWCGLLEAKRLATPETQELSDWV